MMTMMMMQSVIFVYDFTAKQLFEHSNILIASNSGWQVLVKDLDDGHDNDDAIFLMTCISVEHIYKMGDTVQE